MFTVFVGGVLFYAGGDQAEALVNLKNLRLKHPDKDVTFRMFDDYAQLEAFMQQSKSETVAEAEIDPFEDIEKALAEFSESVVDQFDKWGFNQDLAERVQKNSEEVIAQVQKAGHNGLKIISDGFATLSGIFKTAFEAAPEKPKADQKRTPKTTQEILDAIRRAKGK